MRSSGFKLIAVVLAKDLEAFALHGGRKTIQPDDVMLCARKVPSLVRLGMNRNDCAATRAW